MKISLWAINYAPELTGIAPFNVALCEYLSAQGHEVEVVTAFPYYPEWKRRADDFGRVFRTDVLNGVKIHRCWLYVPIGCVGPRKRILHEATFVGMSLLRMLFLPRPDLFVVVSPPLPLGLAAWFVGLVKRVPFVFHVQDLQPDAAIGLGMLRKGRLTRALYLMESFAYARAARVSGISRGMLRMFREKGVPEEKLIYFPNGVKLPLDLPPRSIFRSRHGISPETFLAVYSGNLGVKQGLDVLVEAARLLRDGEGQTGGGNGDHGSDDVIPGASRPIKIVIAGDGARRPHLEDLIQRLELDNVLLLPLQPEQAYHEMLADADCSVITQQEGTGSFFFPSKLLAALAVGKPIVTVADDESELARASSEGRFGLNVQPNHPEDLARAIRSLAADAATLSKV